MTGVGGRAAVDWGRPVSVAEIQRILREPRSVRAPAHPPAPYGWITVVAAHPGAGASTVALGLAEALAVRHRRPCHLIETAPPTRSGLLAATRAELGLDGSGGWRRGTRGPVTVDRRAEDFSPTGWPPGLPGPDPLGVLDLWPDGATDDCLLRHVDAVVLVSRATVPGLRAAQTALDGLCLTPAALATVGAGWSGPVRAAAGPALVRLRRGGRVVEVPLARRLALTGPTGDPLPRGVRLAAARLAALADAPAHGDVA